MIPHNESTDRLFSAVAALRTPEECYRFFEDLCTIKEIRDMAQRLEAAVLLYGGGSYQEVGEKVGLSSATICRVNKCLHYGEGGYRAAIEKLKADGEPR